MTSSPVRPLPSRLRTVFLDRDGVLNEKAPEGAYVSRWDEFRMLPGVADAIARLNRAGLRVIVVSNQRGIARGLYSAADVDTLHSRLQEELWTSDAHIDAFFICPHDLGQCNCRKPLTGLFEQAAARFPGITPETSIVIGDSASDMEFGQRLGMATILITGPGRSSSQPSPTAPDPEASATRDCGSQCAASLLDAVEILLNWAQM